MAVSNFIRCKVKLGEHSPRIGLRCGKAGVFGTSASFDGEVIHLTADGFMSVNEAHPGLLTEQKKPGRKPKAEPKPTTKAAPPAAQPDRG